MRRPHFPEREYEELQRMIRHEAPQLGDLAARVGSDWLDDAEVEALVSAAVDYYFGNQLGRDGEPLADAGIFGDDVAALVEQQRRSFWDQTSSG